MKSYKGTIAECWLPTFENVSREFITQTLYKILFSEELPNFRFAFMEDEAIAFIEKVLSDYSQKYDFYQKESQKILQTLKQKNENAKLPVMIVNNYRQFFELLRQFYEKDIELYFLRSEMSGLQRYEKDNCFELIWLRATPDDFHHPEEFLRKQVEMINDNTFEKYDKETCLGKMSFLDNHILCVKNGIARPWDENSREIEITIYDKKYYDNKELFDRPHYTLPVIRYGIFEENGNKVCSIGSIQDKMDSYEKNNLGKKVERAKYRVNAGVPEEDTYKVEPKMLLSLSIFINMLHKEGINEIEVPSLYVLDYDYHIRRNPQILSAFEKKWTDEKIKKYPEVYKEATYHFERAYKKEDLISEIKTERLLLIFRRLLHHYSNGHIFSYPGDADSFMHLKIPRVECEEDINGKIFKELYKLQEQPEEERYKKDDQEEVK